jgi:hypothetical protein
MSTLTARERGDGKGSSRRFTYPTTHRCMECGTVVRLVFIPGPTERVLRSTSLPENEESLTWQQN